MMIMIARAMFCTSYTRTTIWASGGGVNPNATKKCPWYTYCCPLVSMQESQIMLLRCRRRWAVSVIWYDGHYDCTNEFLWYLVPDAGKDSVCTTLLRNKHSKDSSSARGTYQRQMTTTKTLGGCEPLSSRAPVTIALPLCCCYRCQWQPQRSKANQLDAAHHGAGCVSTTHSKQ